MRPGIWFPEEAFDDEVKRSRLFDDATRDAFIWNRDEQRAAVAKQRVSVVDQRVAAMEKRVAMMNGAPPLQKL